MATDIHYITLHYITLHTYIHYIHTYIHTYLLTYITLHYIYITLHYITYIHAYIYLYIYIICFKPDGHSPIFSTYRVAGAKAPSASSGIRPMRCTCWADSWGTSPWGPIKGSACPDLSGDPLWGQGSWWDWWAWCSLGDLTHQAYLTCSST